MTGQNKGVLFASDRGQLSLNKLGRHRGTGCQTTTRVTMRLRGRGALAV